MYHRTCGQYANNYECNKNLSGYTQTNREMVGTAKYSFTDKVLICNVDEKLFKNEKESALKH